MTLLQPTMVALLLLTGLGVALLGSLKVTLAGRLQIEEAKVGGLVSLFGFVMIPVIFIAGFLTDHLGKQGVLLAGSALFAVSLALLALARVYAGALAAVVLLSAAWSLLINVGNVLTPVAFYPGEPARAANLANVFFGLGAFLTPLVVVALLRRTSWAATLGVIAVVALLPGLLSLGVVWPETTGDPGAPAAAAGGAASLLADPMLWLCGMALFFYGPLEASLGAWATTYLKDRGIGDGPAAGLLSGFWLAFMISRLATALALRPGTERVFLLILAGGCVVVLASMVASRSARVALVLVLAAGLVFGPIFPTVIGMLLKHFPADVHGRAVGLFFAIGGVGWTFIPMLIGAYANRVGVQRAFILAVGAACGLIGVSAILVALR